MFVTLEGEGADGAPLRIDWNLIAEKNHGPHIPCGAAIALARKIGSGASLPWGAMPCMGLLTVDEFLKPLRDLPAPTTRRAVEAAWPAIFSGQL